MFAQFSEPGAGGEERLRAQVGYLAKLSEAMQGADIIRLYGLEVTGERHLPRDAAQYLTQSGGAYDLELSFLAALVRIPRGPWVASCRSRWNQCAAM